MNVIDLSGTWRLRRDSGNVGLAEQWWREPLRDDVWRAIEVPSAWQHVLGTEYHYLAWYRRSVTIPPDWNCPRTRLRFEAVATEARVWIDGEFVGTHVGDYIPFEFDISRFVATWHGRHAHAQARRLCPRKADASRALDIVVRVDEMMGHITKGFHDMVSIHHGGIWQPVRLIGSGSLHAIPDGVAVHGDAATGEVRIAVELAAASVGGVLRAQVEDEDGEVVAPQIEISVGADGVLHMDRPPMLWSPREERPALYTAVVELCDEAGRAETHLIRFGFRDVARASRPCPGPTPVPPNGHHILLNGSPLQIRGILHWGHEPRHVAPAPPPQQVREEFAHLQRLGFNCVCLCMWYPPRHFFEIADEMGMLIWQEHPVWHSPMEEEHLAEYRRLFTAFMRRDRNHPSVTIVSSTCEHPCYHSDLAEWWWRTARERLPGKLLQVQTASFAWSDPAQTDLHDEHTYDNNNRWVHYLRDVQETLAGLPVKPFVMGETILFTSWPDFEAIRQKRDSEFAVPGPAPNPEPRTSNPDLWWQPAYFSSGIECEEQWTERYGSQVVERFRRQGDRHHLLGRKFQYEMFRSYANHAGLVMNHLRDVPQATCGFLDDLDRWRFGPTQTRGWLAEAPLLLWTPDHRRSFFDGERATMRIALSNFSPRSFDGEVTVRIVDGDTQVDGVEVRRVALRCEPGEVRSAEFKAPLVGAAFGPRRVRLETDAEGLIVNDWDLWVFPSAEAQAADALAQAVCRLEGLPFHAEDALPDEEERGYSRGFGLPVKRWVNRQPDPARLAPHLTARRHDEPIPTTARVILTHKLTNPLLDWMQCGGRLILLASKTRGGLGTRYEWLFGQRPLVIEEGPLREGDSDWIVDLLGMDLTRTYCRVIPVEDLGLVDLVDPIVRLVYTHDCDRVKFFDMLFITRVGGGLLMASSFDHSDPAGQYLLRRMIEHMLDSAATATAATPMSFLRHAAAPD